MKLICLLLLCAFAYLNNAAPTPAPDYREKYDHLLIEMINQRIRQAEQFLERVTHQLDEYRKTKDEKLRQHIASEVEFILPLAKQGQKYFDAELKKTGLDILERYETEKAKAETDLVVKLVTEIEKEVAKKPGPEFFAVTSKPIDYRQEYDRLLNEEIQQHIRRADGMLLELNRQLQEYLKTKSAEIKTKVQQEIDFMVPFLKNAEERAATQLKRTELNHLERFLYEKSDDEIKLLLKHYTQIQNALNGKSTLFDYFADPTKAPVVDYRQEYDRLLFTLMEQNVKKADDYLLHLQREVNEYVQHKNKDLADRITRGIEFVLPLVKSAIQTSERELKRTDLNTVERYLYEKVRDEANILIKHYTQIEAEVKK